MTTTDNLNDLEPIAGKIPSGIVTLDQLRALPEPQSLGNRHRPVPHDVLAEAVEAELRERGFDLTPKWELSFNGQRLDGVMELFDRAKYEAQRAALVASRQATYTGINAEAVQQILPEHLRGGHGALLEVSHSNDRSRALHVKAGVRVFVCNNLATDVGGDGFTARRKHTGDSTWDERLRRLFDGAFASFQPFGQRIEAMQNARLTDRAAKAFIFDYFSVPYPLLPRSAFTDIGAIYLGHATEDVAEQSRWSLHNAFTRYMSQSDMGPRRQSEAGAQLTRMLSADLLPIEPAADPN